MYRIANRALALWVAIAVLLGGLGFFLYEYITQAPNWVLEPGNPNLYEDGKLSLGILVDRQGISLLDLTDGRNYSPNTQVRMSTLHWVGDRRGNIAPTLITQYEQALANFDLVNGLYDYGGIGGTMHLTLSAQVQMVALEAMGGYKGTVAVYNYRTGEILCAISTPTFDPDAEPDLDGDAGGAYDGVYFNRFLQSVYIPGSIFKIVTTAAALEQLPEIQAQQFTCQGTYSFGVDQVSCERAHGTMGIREAMMRSCNCIYAQIALQLGGENLERYVRQFGVTDRISFDGFTTAAGNYQATGTADVNLAWSAVGQYNDQINPCAYLTFVGAIANGGQGVTPYVVSHVTVGNHITYQAQTQARQRILPEETAQILQEYMRNNVVSNYGADNFPGLTVCAKSGTGEVGGGKKPNAMFTGFVADEAYPLAFLVAVEDGGYGRAVCVPIIAQVLQACKAVLDGSQ